MAVSGSVASATGEVSETGERSAGRGQQGAEEEPRDCRVQTAQVGERMQQVRTYSITTMS